MKVKAKQIADLIQYITDQVPDLSHREFRVFMSWLTDAPDFSAGAQILSDRTGIARQSCAEALTRLEQLGLIQFKRMAGTRREFELSPGIIEMLDTLEQSRGDSSPKPFKPKTKETDLEFKQRKIKEMRARWEAHKAEEEAEKKAQAKTEIEEFERLVSVGS